MLDLTCPDAVQATATAKPRHTQLVKPPRPRNKSYCFSVLCLRTFFACFFFLLSWCFCFGRLLVSHSYYYYHYYCCC